MQDIRKYINIVKNEQTPQAGDAFDLEFGNDRAVISTVIEQVIDDAIILKADDKAIDFISKLPVHEDHCGCAMCQGPEEPDHEEHEELDHEVSMGRSQMYHTMKNAKAIHDMLQRVSEREGIEGWVASKLTKASDYLKVVKDYLEYEMVQAGFDKKVGDTIEAGNSQDIEEDLDDEARNFIDYIQDQGYKILSQGAGPRGISIVYQDREGGKHSVDFKDAKVSEAKYQGKTVKLNKPIRTGTNEPGKFKVYVKDPKTGNVKMVRFGHQGGGKNKDSKTMRIKKSNPARRKSFRARHNCDNPGPKTKARYWSCRPW